MQVKHITHYIIFSLFFLIITQTQAQSISPVAQEVISDDGDLTGICGFHILDQKARQMGIKRAEISQKNLRDRGKLDGDGNTIDDYVGQHVDFWTYDFYNKTDEQIAATCKAVGEHCYVYVSDVESISQGTIDAIANEFDLSIYDTDRNCFGSEWKPGIDGDNKVTILIFNIKDTKYYVPSTSVYTAGYYYSLDETTFSHSNQREMFYMDCNPATPGSNSFYRTLAHEFQHMIHWNEDGDEDVWVNEGCSGYAEFICGYGWRTPTHFFSNPDNKLTLWSQQLADYEQCFLFILYLYEQFDGAPTIKKIVQEQSNGTQGIMDVLQSLGYTISFNQIFQNWNVANYLDDTGLDEGQYGYSNINLASYPITPVHSWSSYPASSSGEVNSYAADYVKFTNGSNMNFTFSGANSGLLLKKGSAGNEVEDISGTINVADFGTTFDEIILLANGYSSSLSYSYSVQTASEDVTNLSVYTGSGANNSYSYNTSSHVCSFNISVANPGDLPVNSFRVGFYLSANSTINTGDYLVTYTTATNLASGAYVNLNGTVDLDNFSATELPAGTYYAGAFIDYNAAVTEEDETDNTYAYSGTINWVGAPPPSPDLVIYTGTGAINTFQYNTMTRVCSFQSTIKNIDSGAAGSFRVGWYLSADQSITTGDKLLAYAQHTGLSAAATVTLAGTRNLEEICDQLTPGTYYAGAIVDYNSTVTESNEFNNDYTWSSPQVIWTGCRLPVTVTIPQDLECGMLSGDTFTALVNVDDVTGKEIYAYGFDLVFDKSDLQVTGVSTTGTISAGWGAPLYNSTTTGIRVTGAGASALSGSGVLLKITFSAITNHLYGEINSLYLQNFIFNEGSPVANTTNGKVTYTGTLAISGYIKYFLNDTPISNTIINLTGGTTAVEHSNEDGYFNFSNLPYGQNYGLNAVKAKSTEREEAISTYDASYVLRYYVGILSLNEEQKIAADVSGNGEITPFDASIILRYYVEQDVSQYAIGSWKFIVPALTDWLTPDTSYNYEELNTDQTEQNLTGILVGDVSGNWAGSELNKGTDGTLVAGTISTLPGNLVQFPVTVQGVSAYQSIGIDLTITQNLYEVVGVALAPNTENVMLAWQENNGRLKIAAVSANAIKASDIVQITLKSKTENVQNAAITLNSYEIDSKRVDTAQQWAISVVQPPQQFALMQNYPNPFNPSTHINYNVPKTVHVSLVVYNTLGQKIVELVNKDQNTGVYSMEWNGRDQYGMDAPSGVYIARLSADIYQKSIKIVKTK